MRQDFLQCFPVNIVFGTSGLLADLTVQDPPPDFGPLLHICIHPRPPLLQKSELSTIKSLTHKSAGDHLGATLLKQFTTPRQTLRFLAVVYSLTCRN